MDSKARFVLTLVLALTAYLVSQLGGYMEAHARWTAMPTWAPTFFVILDAMALASLFCFITTAITVVRTIAPRLSQHSGRPSPLFFATIAQTGIEDFKATMRTITPNQVIDLLAEQTYDNAKIIAQKTSSIRGCIRLFYWGMACFFAFTIETVPRKVSGARLFAAVHHPSARQGGRTRASNRQSSSRTEKD